MVDTNGLVIKALVTGANIQDGNGAILLLDECQGEFDRLLALFVDSAYWREQLNSWLLKWTDWALIVVRKFENQVGFMVHPKRWIVERTFAWLGKFRRLSKDYEYLTETSTAVIYAVMIRLNLAKLAKN